ncbi:hypothetical protein J2W98_000536 [Paenibacillus peoriae]|uniref:Uncharacterized protein n=1 Tax=Paenibacillus peoriae TaxID=59893 RepID=A0ABU1Q9H9_9BACL|nr:hypothetical protein [Paenibacillus peoriae]
MNMWEFMDQNIVWVVIMFVSFCIASTYWGKSR